MDNSKRKDYTKDKGAKAMKIIGMGGLGRHPARKSEGAYYL